MDDMVAAKCEVDETANATELRSSWVQWLSWFKFIGFSTGLLTSE
jgi:hypothetical protein